VPAATRERALARARQVTAAGTASSLIERSPPEAPRRTIAIAVIGLASVVLERAGCARIPRRERDETGRE
jgi:hypothetical protein